LFLYFKSKYFGLSTVLNLHLDLSLLVYAWRTHAEAQQACVITAIN